MIIQSLRQIELQSIPDETRGLLGVAEFPKHIPFTPKRLFYFVMQPAGAQRGGHAHIKQHQFIITLSGVLTVHGWDRDAAWTERLDTPSVGLYCAPMTWLEITFETQDAVVAVLASDIYDEADYIRDRSEFDKLIRNA